MSHDVVISHSRQDAEVAAFVCSELELHGVACWISSRDVPPGIDFSEAVVEAIDQCRTVVLILSNAANTSRYVKAEVGRAASLKKVIYTLRIEDIEPSAALLYSPPRHMFTDSFPLPLDKRILAHLLWLNKRTDAV